MRPPCPSAALLTGALAVACSAGAGAGTSEGTSGGVQATGGATGTPGAGGASGSGGSPATGGALVVPGTGDGGQTGCVSFDQTATNTREPADVIWAVDNGSNMQANIQFVRDNLDAFSKQIIASGVDARIILISKTLDPDVITAATPLGGPAGDWRAICVDAPLGSGSCPDDTNPPHFYHLDQEVGAGSGLIPILDRTPLNVFTNVYAQYSGWLRPNAAKTFVAVTDQDGTAAPNSSAAAFTAAVKALDPAMFPTFEFSAVVAYSPCPSFLFPSVRGQVYLDLVQQTGGVSGDLCTQNFAPVFDDIAKGVVGASKLDCEWVIPPPPANQVLDPRKVNVSLRSDAGESSFGAVDAAADCATHAGGWYYDAPGAPTKVVACPETCDAIRAAPNPTLSIAFGCETVTAELR